MVVYSIFFPLKQFLNLNIYNPPISAQIHANLIIFNHKSKLEPGLFSLPCSEGESGAQTQAAHH